ncbi:hypothetical protein [Streptomyces sp. NPDC002671]
MSDNDMPVRELLGRAVDTVPVPAGRGSESVFARASRVRRGRRAAATGAVAAAVAAGVVFGSGVLPGREGQNVAASPTAAETGFGKLLPPGVGTVREVSLGQIIKGTTKPLGVAKVGPYDGEYAVTRGGGTGFITVRVVKKAQNVDKAPCAMPHESPRKENCTQEKVSGGGLLTLWQWPAQKAVQPAYSGPELNATLLLKDGTLVSIRDWTGFAGKGALGPVLKSFPLTRTQLRELALKPQLLP